MDSKFLTASARLLSLLLHPFAMPLYAGALLFFGDTVLYGIPYKLKYYYLALVALTTMVIPALSVALLGSLGVVRGVGLEDRRDRMLPLAVVLVCYVACVWLISDATLLFLIRKFLLAAIGCLVMAIAVNFLWKISMHMIAVGGMTAMLSLVDFAGYGRLEWALCLWILLSGLLGSSRLLLGKHNSAQVYAGYFGGLVIAAAVMLLF